MTKPFKIVAIGGGELKTLETLAIDRRVVELTGKKNPKALFIPTASGDADSYIETFDRVYGIQLGCRTASLKLTKEPSCYKDIAASILHSDLVYAGGGNTLRMMKLWRRLGVDNLLRQAASRGIVLAGLSAGAICWFTFGDSDSQSFWGCSDWDYIRVRGLGLINALYCPHYHKEKREVSLAAMVARYGGVAIACDDNAAIEVIGGGFRVLTSSQTGKAYKLFKYRNEIVTEPLCAENEHAPISDLLKRSPARDRILAVSTPEKAKRS